MGRFAPSPTGDLHVGSLFAATASYLDARSRGGRWLIRIEDLDTPRIVPGSEASMLESLQRFGFEWDDLTRQSERTERYAAALEDLRLRGLTFACSCSRSQLADEARYPGHCRAQPSILGVATATRLRIEPGHIQFSDRIQGTFRQDVAAAVGDVTLRRRDGFFAYVLAVVVDDAAQGVSDVVRGADLLDNTPRQIMLQHSLRLPTPRYAHVPALVEADGRKLAKSARSVAVDTTAALPELIRVFDLLGLAPPASLRGARLRDAWAWAIAQWRVERVPKRLSLPVPVDRD